MQEQRTTSPTPTSTCRQCDQPIRWRETPAGKWQPIDPDGAVHFSTCPKRPRNNYPSNVCIACGSTNIEIGPGVGPHHGKLRCLDCQAFRWLPKPR